ncbi:MAG: hypothetical protein ACM3SR_02125 [Ignavibacteriales bacterium]|jgi:hypothetical protein
MNRQSGKGKKIGLLFSSLFSILALLGVLSSGVAVYLGLFPRDSHIGIGLFAIFISIVFHVLNASASPMNFVSVLFLAGAFWSGLMNIEGKGGDTSMMHIIVAPLAVAVSISTSVLNLHLYVKERRQ